MVQTSINLSSSTRGDQEQFGSSLPGRLIVRAGLSANKTLHQILPNSLFTALESRMQPVEQVKGAPVLPFDQVRAAINLVVSSILIASATSLKLPLSTTYVTFMVAMGSSFADGAWNRESAVYRISGVLAVISGWFLTAMCAFSACALVTWALFEGGSVVAVLFMLVAVVSLVRSNFFGKKKEESSFDIAADNTDKDSIRANIGASVDESIDTAVRLMREGLTAFQAEDEKILNRCKNEAVNLFEDISRSRGSYYRMALRGGGDDLDNEARHIYYRIFNGMKELAMSCARCWACPPTISPTATAPTAARWATIWSRCWASWKTLPATSGPMPRAKAPAPSSRPMPTTALPASARSRSSFCSASIPKACPCAAVTCI